LGWAATGSASVFDTAKILGSADFVKSIHPGDNLSGNFTNEIYYWMGKTALDLIVAALDILPSPPDMNAILDFPSGYGRVLRFLGYQWPDSKITACDTDVVAYQKN
jgi:hypothetical protein